MDFYENLKAGVITEDDIQKESRSLLIDSNIDGYDVPETLAGIKERLKGLLAFRNDNQDLNPNCYELADITLSLNNALASEMEKENPDLAACERITQSFEVLYENVAEHALVGKKLADKKSSLYALLSSMKKGLSNPQKISDNQKQYMQVLSGVNFYQRERLKEGEVALPNECETQIIAEADKENLPDDLKIVCENIEKDISEPQKMLEVLSI